jgi:hypothetical protein
MKKVSKGTLGGLSLNAPRDDVKDLPPGGRWLPGCTSDTESYIHPVLGWRATRLKVSGKADKPGDKAR